MKRSASSWGCELKYHSRCSTVFHRRQPLREAVSWNFWEERRFRPERSQPLREAVSWNNNIQFLMCYWILSASSWGCELKCQFSTNPHAVPGVSLFVRLWVEMWLSGSAVCWPSSASSWGCELKCAKFLYGFNGIIVSLFVRLWVEISSINCFYSIIWTSASSWGCELK